jgi:capsular exopolysaccharide synthesis family protein
MQDNLLTEMPAPAAAPISPAPVTYYSDEFDQGFHLRDYWHILKKRKWWFWGVLSGVVVVVLLVTLLMSPIYKVTATLQIIQDNPSALMGGEKTDPLRALTGSSELDRFYETQYKILQSPTIAYGLIDSLKLKDHPSYKQMERDNPNDPPEVIRQKYAKYLLDNLKVEPVKNSYLVNISYKSTDKQLAQKVPGAMQKEYLKLAMTTRQQSYAMLREWLDNELTRLGNKLELSEKSVYADGQKKDFLSLEAPETNVTIQKYLEVSKLLTMAQADKAGKEAQYRQIKEKGADAPLITNHALIQQLRQQLIGLEAQVSGDNKIFGTNFPDYKAQTTKLKDLRQRLNQEIKRLEASIRADYEAASRAESLLQKEFDLQKGKVIDLQNSLVQHHILKRDLQTNQTLYEGLLARMKEASVASTMVASNVSVITAAEPPYKPWLPKPLLFLALALVIGSMGGVMAAFFVEYLDNSIKTTEELEKVVHIPALGVVPLYSDNSKKLAKDEQIPVGLIPHNQPMSMLSEAIFQIRAAIMLSVSEGAPQALMITSPNPDEGKTTLASNLAAVMASPDRKCLIMDCDLRKPSLHKIYSLPLQPGLTNYLTGNATLEEIIRPSGFLNLYFIPAGPAPPNPNELFNSNAFKNLVNHLRQEFQQIIIDSPPVIGFADGRSIAASADGVLVLVKHHSTTREAGRLAIQLLSQTNCRILGGILTMARKDRLGYGGYYGYYQYYHKYYKGYQGPDGGKSPEKTRTV